jgi:hypothetical protein
MEYPFNYFENFTVPKSSLSKLGDIAGTTATKTAKSPIEGRFEFPLKYTGPTIEFDEATMAVTKISTPPPSYQSVLKSTPPPSYQSVLKPSTTTDLAKTGTTITDLSKTGTKINDIGYLQDVLKTAQRLGDDKYISSITKQIDNVKNLPTTPVIALSKTTGDTIKSNFTNLAKTIKTPQEFLTKYGDYVKYAIGGITITTIVTIAAIESEKINNTNYSITSIQKDPNNPSYTIISYTPAHKFDINDIISITNSNSIDPIDGTDIPIYDILGDGKIKINKSIKVEGSKGILKCSTNFGNQVAKTVNNIVDPVVTQTASAAKSIAGNTIDTTLQAVGLPTLSQITENLKTYWWVVLIIILIPLILSFLLVIITQL